MANVVRERAARLPLESRLTYWRSEEVQKYVLSYDTLREILDSATKRAPHSSFEAHTHGVGSIPFHHLDTPELPTGQSL